MEAHGIMFHHFHNDKHIKCQGSISAEELRALIDFYSRSHTILSAEVFLKKALEGKLNYNDVCLSFDDALLCQYEVAKPVLDDMGLKAFWFIYTAPFENMYEKLEIYHHFRFWRFDSIDDFYNAFFNCVDEIAVKFLDVDIDKALSSFDPKGYKKNSAFYTYNDKKFRYIRDVILGKENYDYVMMHMMDLYHYRYEDWVDLLWMKREQVRKLNDEGHCIGLHSHTHPTTLADMETKLQFDEYSRCKQILEDIIKQNVVTVSYPCNSFNNDTTNIMQKLDIKIGFTATLKDSNGSLYIPREDHTNIVKEMREQDENNCIYK